MSNDLASGFPPVPTHDGEGGQKLSPAPALGGDEMQNAPINDGPYVHRIGDQSGQAKGPTPAPARSMTDEEKKATDAFVLSKFATPASAPEVTQISQETKTLAGWMPRSASWKPAEFKAAHSAIQLAFDATTASLRDELRRAEARALVAEQKFENHDCALKAQDAVANQLRTQLAEAKAEREALAHVVHLCERYIATGNYEEAGLVMQAYTKGEILPATKQFIERHEAQLTALQAQADREGEAAKVEIGELRNVLTLLADEAQSFVDIGFQLSNEADRLKIRIAQARASTDADFEGKIVVSRAEWERLIQAVSGTLISHTEAAFQLAEELGYKYSSKPPVECIREKITAIAAESEKDKARVDLLDDCLVEAREAMSYGPGKIIVQHAPAGYGADETTTIRNRLDAALAQQASSEGEAS